MFTFICTKPLGDETLKEENRYMRFDDIKYMHNFGYCLELCMMVLAGFGTRGVFQKNPTPWVFPEFLWVFVGFCRFLKILGQIEPKFLKLCIKEKLI